MRESFAESRILAPKELMSEARIAHVFADHLDLFPRSQTPKLARHLIQLCAQHGFDPAFVLSLIQVESNFRVGAVSPAGAIGLLQLMPATAAELARRNSIPYNGARSLRDPYTNITLGLTYLALLRERYQGYSTYFPIAAYNLGPARLDHLRSKKGFKPAKTKLYFDKIRAGVQNWRFYSGLTAQKKRA